MPRNAVSKIIAYVQCYLIEVPARIEEMTQQNHQNSKILITSEKTGTWHYPSKKLIKPVRERADAGDPNEISKIIDEVLFNHGIEVNVEEANVGSRLTQYLAKITKGEVPSNLTKLNDVLSSALDINGVCIVTAEMIPSVISVEVPNIASAVVSLGRYLDSAEFNAADSKLAFILGLNLYGKLEICDLGKVQHLLITGQTGSGKSLFFDNILVNLLIKNSPSELRLIAIDPKYVQFTAYKDIPHLITPIVNDPEHAKSAILWAIEEIDRRYKYFAQSEFKNINSYNENTKIDKMPNILVVCDEIADLMMLDGKFYDDAFMKIAQKGGEVGVHVIISTSRPSTDVITDTMLDNIHTKLAFTASNDVDSKRIINRSGAENLLSRGDFLYKDVESSSLKRIQAPYLTDDDVVAVTSKLRSSGGANYLDLHENTSK